MRNANITKRSSLDVLVSALCRDYFRREEAIKKGGATKRTLTEFRYLNFKIAEAVEDVVGNEFVEFYIKEIGENIGYANSKTILSEVAYKERKKQIKDSIARKLYLSD